jgi:NAD(P)-dependent dehydrogenase (short-subunit alcohol dehydrogenase family)
MNKWSIDMIPDMTGKRVVITGASSGLGLEVSKVLSSKGAEVILAVRSLGKGEKAVRYICSGNPSAKVRLMQISMDSLQSVKDFCHEFLSIYDTLDILVNNAGVMFPPFTKSADNLELQFATNHIGHFALTGLLMPALRRSPAARVVTVSSIAARMGTIDFDNLDGSKGYSSTRFYSQSKYANLLFGKEFDKRLKMNNSTIKSIICHPGVSATNLASRGSGKERITPFKFLFNMIAQPAHMGALPLLYSVSNPDLKGGEYVGPEGFQNIWGYPAVTTKDDSLYKKEIAERLWAVSEKLTGVNII